MMLLIFCLPGFLTAGIAAAFGWGFSNWQFWACVLPVAIGSGALYLARGF